MELITYARKKSTGHIPARPQTSVLFIRLVLIGISNLMMQLLKWAAKSMHLIHVSLTLFVINSSVIKKQLHAAQELKFLSGVEFKIRV